MPQGTQKKTSAFNAKAVPFPTLKFIDLFSGIGGIRLALSDLGAAVYSFIS